MIVVEAIIDLGNYILERCFNITAESYKEVLVEALVALCYHISRRAYNIRPGTSVEAFKVLMDRGLITYEEFSDFVKLVRLRNLLVHRYWVIDDKRLYDEAKRDFRKVKEFLWRVKNVFNL